MNRVPASLVLLLLHQEADARQDDRLRVGAAALRQWVHRGHITRGPGGYDLAEILTYLEQRERSTSVDDLITWLRAQLDEIEFSDWHERSCQTHRQMPPGSPLGLGGSPMTCNCRVPEFVMADVATKRKILGLVTDAGPPFGDGYTEAYRDVVKLLAVPYADRSGYLDAWRPE